MYGGGERAPGGSNGSDSLSTASIWNKEVLTLAAPIESQVVSEIDPIAVQHAELVKKYPVVVLGKEVIFNVPPLYGKDCPWCCHKVLLPVPTIWIYGI